MSFCLQEARLVRGIDKEPDNVAPRKRGAVAARLRRLDADEQIDDIEALWDRVFEFPESVPVPDWHRELIAKRLNARRENPQRGNSWQEVRRRIGRRFVR